MGVILNLFFLLLFQPGINPFAVGVNYVETRCYAKNINENSFNISTINDPEGKYDVADVWNLPESLFNKNQELTSEVGHTYWLKITNKNEEQREKYILMLHDLVDRIDVFSEPTTSALSYSGGINSKSTERKVLGLGYTSVCFESAKGDVTMVKIKALPNSTINFNDVRITSYPVYLRIWMSENIIQLFFSGILFVFFLILLTLSFMFKKRYQLYLSLSFLSVSLRWTFTYNLAELIIGDLPKFELFMNWMIFPVQFFFLLFARDYFELKNKHVNLYKTMNLYLAFQIVLAALAIPVFFTSVMIFSRIVSFFAATGLVFGIFAILIFWKNFTTPQKVIFLGLLILSVFNLIFRYTDLSLEVYFGFHLLQVCRVFVSTALVILLGLDAFDLLNFFKVQQSNLIEITQKSESLEAKYHKMLADIAEQEKLVSAKNVQLAHVNEMLHSLENENPEIKRNHEFSKWKKNTADSTQNWHEFDDWFNNSNEMSKFENN